MEGEQNVMTNEPVSQTINQLKNAANILVLVPSGGNLDAVASSLALSAFLSVQGKQVRILSPNPVSPKFSFLPDSGRVALGAGLVKNLVVEVNLNKTELAELSYQKQAEKLKIFLTPKVGEFEPSDVAVHEAVYPFDLIVTLGMDNPETLGNFYTSHVQMFFEIPLVNIDHRPSNESFGQVNLINLTASSVSEIIFDMLTEYDQGFIDEKIATLLLSGLIHATNSFQSQKTSPQVFEKASRLVVLGANQQEIISELYRSKSLGMLRLWGRVLARLKTENNEALVYSAVSAEDVQKSGAGIYDVDEIIFEMAGQLSFAKCFVFFAEESGNTVVYVAGAPGLNLFSLLAKYQPQGLGSGAMRFEIHKPLLESQAEILELLRPELAKWSAS